MIAERGAVPSTAKPTARCLAQQLYYWPRPDSAGEADSPEAADRIFTEHLVLRQPAACRWRWREGPRSAFSAAHPAADEEAGPMGDRPKPDTSRLYPEQ